MVIGTGDGDGAKLLGTILYKNRKIVISISG
jgi:hypothetical protein